MRPTAATGWRNFFLAGDWTDTGLPATIEGAIVSGTRAACAVDEAAWSRVVNGENVKICEVVGV
jgi:uncharacterized protein with NAD-binding domain and iron-sulfur cluster